MNQNFTIQPQGLIQGGSASYLANTESGAVSYSAQIVVGLIFGHSYSSSGTYNVPPPDLLSDMRPGEVINIGPAVITVLNVSDDPSPQAHVSFTITGKQISGSALLDLSGTYWSVIDLTAVATIDGITFNLHLVPVS